MNILIITPVFPYPLNSGGAQAQFNMIEKMRDKYSITLLYIQKSIKDNKKEKELQKIWPNVKIVSYKYSWQLLSWTFLYNKAVRAFKILFFEKKRHFIVERALKPYGIFYTDKLIRFVHKSIINCAPDIIQMEFYPCLHMVKFLPANIRRIFIHHEIRFIRNERLLKDIVLNKSESEQYIKLKKQEIEELNLFDRIVTLTDVDKKILLNNQVSADIKVSPAAINSAIHSHTATKNKLLLLGGYSHKPNVEGTDWFIHEIAKKIKTNCEIHLIGFGWPLQKIDSYINETQKDIIYHGFQKDLYAIAKGSIMVIPILTGSGMRMKILEAAAMGLPFITTSVGVEGLNFANKESCLIANTPEQWLEALENLLNDESLGKRLADKAQDIYIKYYSLEASVAIRERIYKFN